MKKGKLAEFVGSGFLVESSGFNCSSNSDKHGIHKLDTHVCPFAAKNTSINDEVMDCLLNASFALMRDLIIANRFSNGLRSADHGDMRALAKNWWMRCRRGLLRLNIKGTSYKALSYLTWIHIDIPVEMCSIRVHIHYPSMFYPSS